MWYEEREPGISKNSSLFHCLSFSLLHTLIESLAPDSCPQSSTHKKCPSFQRPGYVVYHLPLFLSVWGRVFISQTAQSFEMIQQTDFRRWCWQVPDLPPSHLIPLSLSLSMSLSLCMCVPLLPSMSRERDQKAEWLKLCLYVWCKAAVLLLQPLQ